MEAVKYKQRSIIFRLLVAPSLSGGDLEYNGDSKVALENGWDTPADAQKGDWHYDDRGRLIGKGLRLIRSVSRFSCNPTGWTTPLDDIVRIAAIY